MATPDDATVRDPEAARRIAAEATTEPPTEVDPLVGGLIGAYRIDGVLGRGGMGVVYRAWDARLERPVALKTVLFDRPGARARFLREARLQAKLQHKNVVTVHVVGEHGGLVYLVMELVPGGSVRDLLDREGALPETRALEICSAIASALEAAHARSLIHRDVKPSNILVEADGNVLLTDFGIAKELRGSDDVITADPDSAAPIAVPPSLTSPGAAVGTPAYAAPEQRRGEHVDHRADIYALGVTLRELLSGERSTEADGVTPATAALLARMVAEDPHERFATYADLRAALQEALGERRLADASRTKRAVAYVLDFVLFFLLAVIATLFLRVGFWIVSGIEVPRSATGIAYLLAAFLFLAVEARYATTGGKALFRLTVVEAMSTRRPSRRALLVRGLVKMTPWLALVPLPSRALPFAVTLPPFIGIILLLGLPAFGSRRVAIHDRVSRTRVMRVL